MQRLYHIFRAFGTRALIPALTGGVFRPISYKLILSFRGELDPASRTIRGKDEKNCLNVGKELDTSKYSIPF
jgi:hypothetical protein